MTKCTACGATYLPLLADGTRYFHVCPPLSDADVVAALGVPSDDAKQTPAHKAAIAAASRVRANARNENVPDAATLKPLVDTVQTPDHGAYWKQVNALLDAAVVSPGAGVTVV